MWQNVPAEARPREAGRLAPVCSASSNRGHSGGGRDPTTVLRVLPVLTSQEAMEVAPLVPKELTNLYPAAKSDFKASGQHPARQPRADGEGKSW